MDATTGRRRKAAKSRTGRRLGYAISILINVFFLWVVNNLVEWDISWITDDFSKVVWIFNLSLGATIAANVLYLFFDPPWFKSLGQIVTVAISVAVAVRLWQVFPVSFTGDFPWTGLFRVALVVGIVGGSIGIVVELVKLIRIAAGMSQPEA
jgi:hypothetical protein